MTYEQPYTLTVDVGVGATQQIPNPAADPQLEWMLRYARDPTLLDNKRNSVRLAAASVLDGFEYLISGSISMSEATRRLRLLRAAWRARSDAVICAAGEGDAGETTRDIEVIDQYNARHRFPSENHRYEWRLKPGSIDVEGTEFLDVLRQSDDDDESEVVATFPRPARVGVVTDTTALTLPMRELPMAQCPRCGFVKC